MNEYPVSLTLRNAVFAALGGLIMLTVLVYVKNHKHPQESKTPAAAIVASVDVDDSAPDLGQWSDLEQQPEVTEVAVACPWGKKEFTLAMCQEWITMASINFRGQKVTDCGVVPEGLMKKFDSCEDPESHIEIPLLTTKGQRALLTTDPRIKKPLCDAVLLAKKNHRELRFGTSYRDFAGQVKVYCDHVRGPLSNATPGHSGHGVGIKVDSFLFDDQRNQLTFDNSKPRRHAKKEDADQLRKIMTASGFKQELPRSSDWCFTYQPSSM
jgi:hypothetical protein